MFVELSTEDRLEHPALSVKCASSLSTERESKLYEKKDSGTSDGDSLRSLDIAEVITLASDISKSIKWSNF
jgi:hypothetical protein